MSGFRKQKIIFLSILLLFIVIRLPGLDLPYHQDENKYATSVSVPDSNTPHPPISKAIFVYTAKIFGHDNFRTTPFLFSIANLFLLYYLVRFKFGRKEAIWSVLFFTATFYSVLASLMVDIDGAMLPFFLLLSLISYFRWQDATSQKFKIIWGSFLVIAVILGFLTKLSFIIVAGALIFDFLFGKMKQIGAKALVRYYLMVGAFLILLVVSLLSAKFLFNSFDLSQTIGHATDYFKISGRSYLQILIQTAKALMYSSPLLVLPLIFVKKADFRKLRPLFIFLILGLIFYLVVFDFSRAALDKYLTFLIVPLSVISGVIITRVLSSKQEKPSTFVWSAGLAISVLIFSLQFLPHLVPPLYPKEEWVNMIMRFRWNFVFPFTGGSGPTGFYISWLFIGATWFLSALLVVLALIKKQWRNYLVILFLVVGFVYNGVFIEEYLFGKINGSPNLLIKNAIGFIEKNEQIKKVITYNDNGGPELATIGKYERRLYAAPKFEKSYIDILKNFKGHYLLIDIPHLNLNSPYAKHFKTCELIYEEYHKKISSAIYDCKNSEDAANIN